MSDSTISDPYERFLAIEKYRVNFVPYSTETKFLKKWEKLISKAASAKTNMINGAKMGALVGGLFGCVAGIYSSIQTRRFVVIPISIIISSISFAFILGCGSLIRSDETGQINQLEENAWMNVQEINRKLKSEVL